MNRIFLFAILLSLASQTKAQNPQAFSLKQAQDYALQNSFSAKTTANAIQQAKANVDEAVAVGLPQISGTGDFTQFIEIPTTVMPNFIGQAISEQLPGVPPGPEYITAQFGTRYNVTFAANARQMLFDPTWVIGVQGAKMYVEKMRNLDKKNAQELKAVIEQAYYTVLVAERNVTLMEQNLSTLEKTLFETGELYKTGFAEESDVDQLSLLVSNTKTNINRAKRQSETAKNLLKFQMGFPLENDIQLTDNLESLWLLNNHEALISTKFDATKNINYHLADMEVTLNNYLVRIEKAKYLPTGSAFINYQTQALRNDFSFFDTKQRWFQASLWGVGIKMPIFDSFRNAASIKRLKLNLENIKDQKTLAEQRLKLEESTARSNYISAFEQLRAEEENIKLAEKIRNKTVVKFNEGIAGSSELTQTETQLLATQGAYINSLFQLLNAKAELNKILSTY